MKSIVACSRCSHAHPRRAGAPECQRDDAPHLRIRGLRTAAFGPARWIRNGTAYHGREIGGDPDASDIVRYETATVPERLHLGTSVGARRANRSADFETYAWIGAGTCCCCYTNTEASGGRIRRATTGCSTENRRAEKLGGSNAPPSTLMYANFSRRIRVAYVAGNVYVDDSRRRITASRASDRST